MNELRMKLSQTSIRCWLQVIHLNDNCAACERSESENIFSSTPTILVHWEASCLLISLPSNAFLINLNRFSWFFQIFFEYFTGGCFKCERNWVERLIRTSQFFFFHGRKFCFFFPLAVEGEKLNVCLSTVWKAAKNIKLICATRHWQEKSGFEIDVLRIKLKFGLAQEFIFKFFLHSLWLNFFGW